MIESMGADEHLDPRLEISPRTARFLKERFHVGPGVNVTTVSGYSEPSGLCATRHQLTRTDRLDMVTDDFDGSTGQRRGPRGCDRECSEMDRSEEHEMQSLHLQMLMILNRTPP